MECQSGGSRSRIERTTDVRVTNEMLAIVRRVVSHHHQSGTIPTNFRNYVSQTYHAWWLYPHDLLSAGLLEGFWTHTAEFQTPSGRVSMHSTFRVESGGGVVRLTADICRPVDAPQFHATSCDESYWMDFGYGIIRYAAYQIVGILSCWLDLSRRSRKSTSGDQRLGDLQGWLLH